MERLDKILSQCLLISRSQVKKQLKNQSVKVNGKAIRDFDVKIDPENDEISVNGEIIGYKKHIYIMMNKPEGIVSATDDPHDRTVIDLLPDGLRRIGLFPCGRLDKYTTGLVILTNNGQLAHRLLSPGSHAEKEYYFETKYPFSDEDISSLQNGVDIGGYTTAPCKVTRITDKSGTIILTEGKYHQIKFMFVAVHNQIRSLKRIRFAQTELPDDLPPGSWRFLSEEEQTLLESHR